MSGCKRIRRTRRPGWRKPPGSVYVGRPTLFGNPFESSDTQLSVNAYRDMLESLDPVATVALRHQGVRIADRRRTDALEPGFPARVRTAMCSLRGMDLVCWCPLDWPCHADVLLEYANKRGES